MRHRVHTFKVGRSGAHRRAMLANMAVSLFENGQITTTLVKANEARRFAEKLSTTAKKGEIHHRRLVAAKLQCQNDGKKEVIRKLFGVIAPGYANRQGGYTRILKLGKRVGDSAEMAIIQLVESDVQA